MRKLTIAAVSTMLVASGAFADQASHTPRAVAEAYFAATTASDLDTAGKLFADESIVLEDERVINSQGTVTFLLVLKSGSSFACASLETRSKKMNIPHWPR